MITSRKVLIAILFILCLIPFVGIVIGVGFLLHEIFKTKSKPGILLSCLGIALCFFSTFLFIRYIFTNKDVQPSFVQLSAKQLNTVVMHIEFYKLQNHSYPDSLQQLNDSNLYSPTIQDPILIWAYKSQDSNTTYVYKKMVNKYTFFSVGSDLVPKTKDDIYPSLKLDTAWSGFIRE